MKIKIQEGVSVKIRIQIERNNFFFEVGCLFCGGTIDLGDVIAKAYFDDKHWRDVCFDCLKVGPSGMKKNLIRRVRYLEQQAAAIAQLAAQMELKSPPWNKIQKEKRKIEEEIKKEYGP